MLNSLSLKLDDEVLREVDAAARQLHVPREAFLEEAVRMYLERLHRKRLRTQLRRESELTRDESLRVLHEFEAIPE